MEGTWGLQERGDGARSYAAEPRKFALSVAGRTSWHDYRIDAKVTIEDDRFGQVGVVARAQWSHNYYELLLGRDDRGVKSWFIRQRDQHTWTTLASGPVDYEYDQPYVLRFAVQGSTLEGWLSRDGSAFARLGAAKTDPQAWGHGRLGVVSYGGAARFDDVLVTPGDVLFAPLPNGWGHIALLRDNSSMFPSGKPANGGWYVTPIHATVRASDGKVLIIGFGRKAPDTCGGSTQRETGETWLLDPATLDAIPAGGTMNVQPINEANDDPVHEVLYCAGHNTMADGRIFLSAGTDYTSSGGLPDSSPEHGVRYSRIYNPANNTITRVPGLMTGGHSGARGMKWYPTNLLMPDARVLIFGGFHFSASGPSGVPKPNLSLEMFDPSTGAYSVLTQHESGDADTPPTRGYSNLHLLPKPVPAGSAGGFARSVAISGGVGRVVLFNHEPGPTGAARLHRRSGSLTNNPSSSEKGEGAPSVMLADGTIMYVGGGHSPTSTSQAYFYNPYTGTWGTPLPLGISRVYGDAVQLPDGNVLVVNGYQGAANSSGGLEPGNPGDIVGTALGDVRRLQVINPYDRMVADLPKWPENTHRGYHSIAVLLKDGRVLVGGGKDASHATGCEKNEIRTYEPPYFSAGPRPTITSPGEGATMVVGGPSLTINYTGSVRSTRGVVLMAPGSLTHSFDSGQRYVPLTVTAGGGTSGSVTVLPPANINIAQPSEYMLFLVSDDGVPSEGRFIRLAAPPPRVYNVGGDIYVEAECSSRRSGPFDLIADGTRSAGQYIEVTPGSGDHSTVPDEGKVLWYDLNVTSGGSFNIWLLGQGLTGGDDSVWVSVNGNADTQLTSQPAWGWQKLGTGTFSLPTGRHQLKVKVREDGARVDKIFLTKTTATPTGLGGAAPISCGGPPCTAPTAPSEVTATPGDCQATVQWTNVAGESGYRIRRNNAVLPATIAADQTSFVDMPLAAGTYTYEVQAFQDTCNSTWAAAGAIVVTCSGPPAPSITNLVVNDTATTNPPAGSDGIPNAQQWSVQPSFAGGGGQLAFGDRSYPIGAVPAAASHLNGKPWIRTAADSKHITTSPLASATMTGSFVYLAVDDRHATGFLTGNGFVDQGYNLTVNEGATARPYSVWRKSFTSGSTVQLPPVGSASAPCYFVIVQ